MLKYRETISATNEEDVVVIYNNKLNLSKKKKAEVLVDKDMLKNRLKDCLGKNNFKGEI